jgi:ATP-dependent protease Clp ATPase subunit
MVRKSIKTSGMPKKKKDVHCSFCGKPHTEVDRLIAGHGVYICNFCVEICRKILDKAMACPVCAGLAQVADTSPRVDDEEVRKALRKKDQPDPAKN